MTRFKHEAQNWDLFVALLDEMKDRTLKNFLTFLIAGRYRDEYFESPGSRKNHHSFEGGLASHSLSAAKLGAKICDHYISMNMKVNKDLVVAGIIVHDIGKIRSYAWSETPHKHLYHGKEAEVCEPGYIYTVDGQLLHHIPIGYGMVLEAANDYNEQHESNMMSEKKIRHLLHIILSHHGRRAWSSPVIPQTIEAFIVHSVEMMDGYVDKFNKGKVPRTIYDGTNY